MELSMNIMGGCLWYTSCVTRLAVAAAFAAIISFIIGRLGGLEETSRRWCLMVLLLLPVGLGAPRLVRPRAASKIACMPAFFSDAARGLSVGDVWLLPLFMIDDFV